MRNLLIENIEKHIRLEPLEEAFIMSSFGVKKLRRRQFFVQEGDVSKFCAFVLSGCLRIYFVDSNGFEHIIQFAIEDWWAADMMSFTTGQPGRLYIDALEPSELLVISREKQLALFDECPKFERYFRIITENGFVSQQSRIVENLSLPAIDRYKNFLSRYPQLALRLPQTQIASYIGITPEFLSKLRKQLSGKTSSL